MGIENKSISILGCGWLGLPLARRLIEIGFRIKGSTTSESKLNVLESEKIEPYLLELSEEKLTGNITEFLYKTEILIIDIPPKLRGEKKENFVQKIQNLIPFIEEAKVKKVLFVSSTSVYGDASSSSAHVASTPLRVREDSEENPDTESGKQLLQTEKLLQSNPNIKTSILRFGGLISYDRHPVKYLAGRENLDNPEAPINLIHQEDCIGIIEKIIETNCFGETFNAVAPFHPTRKEYYTQKALQMNLPLPKFLESSASGKIIESLKVTSLLEYTFNLDLY